ALCNRLPARDLVFVVENLCIVRAEVELRDGGIEEDERRRKGAAPLLALRDRKLVVLRSEVEPRRMLYVAELRARVERRSERRDGAIGRREMRQDVALRDDDVAHVNRAL